VKAGLVLIAADVTGNHAPAAPAGPLAVIPLKREMPAEQIHQIPVGDACGRGDIHAGGQGFPPQQFSVRKPTMPFIASKLAE